MTSTNTGRSFLAVRIDSASIGYSVLYRLYFFFVHVFVISFYLCEGHCLHAAAKRQASWVPPWIRDKLLNRLVQEGFSFFGLLFYLHLSLKQGCVFIFNHVWLSLFSFKSDRRLPSVLNETLECPSENLFCYAHFLGPIALITLLV